jgi:hypothetical protein
MTRAPGQRRDVVGKAADAVFDDDEIQLLDDAQQIDAARRRPRLSCRAFQ